MDHLDLHQATSSGLNMLSLLGLELGSLLLHLSSSPLFIGELLKYKYLLIFSIFRYRQVKKECPSCEHKWSNDVSTVMNNLKKVGSFFILGNT